MAPRRLEGKVAVVTGATTGIGNAIAMAFAQEGAAVGIDYHSDKTRSNAINMVEAIKANGGKALCVQADVSNVDDVRQLTEHAIAELGGLDIMVNNAGIEHQLPFVDTPLEVWQKVLAVNLTGVWIGAQEAARRMIAAGKGGRIINISSVHEDLPMPGNAAYCATKGGVRMLMRTIAVELAAHGITVNNIAPGAVDTPIDAATKAAPEKYAALLHEIPLGRMGQPAEIAGLAVFLASDAAAYITGSTYVIDGGLMRSTGAL
jgi:glucose 1-dehydrogenase